MSHSSASSSSSSSNGYPVIDGVAVDIDALRKLAHRCEPATCAVRGACCAHYEVAIGTEELETILGCLDAVAHYAPQIKQTDVYEEEGPKTFVLDTDDDGQCVFAFRRGGRGCRLCGLHAVALAHGLPPERVKPKSCALWPLALAETDPPTLSVQDDALDFPCNGTRRRGEKRLDPGVEAILLGSFGAEFLAKVRALL